MAIEEAAETWRAKRELRVRLLAARSARSDDDRASATDALCTRVLELPEVESAAILACYVSNPEEPGTGPLIQSLASSRHTVLLPLLRSDFDLDWGAYEPGTPLRAGRFGISEPTAPPLGREAITNAGVVICPGLAADERGQRLGRGGGSFDRALSRVPGRVLRVVLLYDDEVLATVPTAHHDQPVDVIVTPRRTLRH